jgi:hypothetical protein
MCSSQDQHLDHKTKSIRVTSTTCFNVASTWEPDFPTMDDARLDSTPRGKYPSLPMIIPDVCSSQDQHLNHRTTSNRVTATACIFVAISWEHNFPMDSCRLDATPRGKSPRQTGESSNPEDVCNSQDQHLNHTDQINTRSKRNCLHCILVTISWEPDFPIDSVASIRRRVENLRALHENHRPTERVEQQQISALIESEEDQMNTIHSHRHDLFQCGNHVGTSSIYPFLRRLDADIGRQ